MALPAAVLVGLTVTAAALTGPGWFAAYALLGLVVPVLVLDGVPAHLAPWRGGTPGRPGQRPGRRDPAAGLPRLVADPARHRAGRLPGSRHAGPVRRVGLGAAADDRRLHRCQRARVPGARLPGRGAAPGDPGPHRGTGHPALPRAGRRARARPAGGAPVSRWWTETVAALGDVVPLPLAALILLAVALLVALGWYFFPAWVPRRLPRFTLPGCAAPACPACPACGCPASGGGVPAGRAPIRHPSTCPRPGCRNRRRPDPGWPTGWRPRAGTPRRSGNGCARWYGSWSSGRWWNPAPGSPSWS
ncbi:hypothetical protein V2I01_20240 [Micromonospora sp. BRA006-A]|nr:hypothetical protein [Micromonospora sp. BRA006-A]